MAGGGDVFIGEGIKCGDEGRGRGLAKGGESESEG